MRQGCVRFLLILIALAAVPGMPARATDRGARAMSPPAAPAATTTPGSNPLPRGCGGVTPPGETEAVCCVSGFVYVDGQPIAGAEVQIQTQAGDQVTVVTQVYSGTESRPHYRLSLSAPPLSVQAGEPITMTARYGGATRSLRYLVHPGGQQVDLVLARPQAEGYRFDRQIWGQAEPRQFNNPIGLALDSTGNSYIVDSGNARVQVFGRDKQFLRQWGSLGNLPGQFLRPAGIAVDASGNVYVADSGNYRIQKFSRLGQFITAWGSSGGADGQFHFPWGVGVDASGSVYVGDRNNLRLQKFSSGGAWLDTWDGLPSGTIDISVDPAGHIYVLGESWIKKFDSSGGQLAMWTGLFNIADPDLPDQPYAISAAAGVVYVSAGSWIYEFSPALQPGNHWDTLPLGFYHTGGIAADGHGYLYAADATKDRMLKFRLTSDAGYVYDFWGETGRANGQLTLPAGVASGNGKIYVADTGNNRVQVFSSDGGWLETWAKIGGAGELVGSNGIAVDGAGNVYVVGDRIQKRDSAGNWTAWGEYGSAVGQFWNPEGIAVDAAGDVYVADTRNSRIQKRDGAGTWSVVADQGSAIGQVRYPHGIAIDGAGNLYVTDLGNGRVQKHDALGNWSVWGSYGSGDGQFTRPYAIAVDSGGQVYMGDSVSGRIQKFSGDGTWLATFGEIGAGPGQFGSEFTFSAPLGLSVDASGKLYVADTANNRVQIFRPMTYTRPIATIQYLSSTTIGAGQRLVAVGVGQDSDETAAIAAYRWTSDRDGVLGSAATLDLGAGQLSPGMHRLSFAVQDSEGQWSDPVEVDLYVAVTPQAQWTMLLYLAGDYADGGRLLDAFEHTLDALRQSFRNPYVRIAVQLDGPAQGDTVRLLISPGSASIPPQVTTLPYGERSMDDPAVLADFVRWGQGSLPAAHYYLSIADHGQGIQGLAWDSTSDPGDEANLTVKELGQALNAAGVAPIDVLHLDACAMNLLEVAYEVDYQQRGQVGIVIASQYLGWDYFAYDAYQGAIGGATTPRDMALGVAARYAALAHADGHPYTIAALDLQRLQPTQAALDRLALELVALIDNGQLSAAKLDALRQASQHFESNGDYLNNQLDLYLDLVDWTRRVRDSVSSPAVRDAAAALLVQLTGAQPLIITSRAESNPLPLQYAGGAYIDLSGSNGLSIFYPQRQDTAAFHSYVTNQLFSFTGVSRWPSFLTAGHGLLCPGCAPEPLPGPLPPLSNQQRVFLPFTMR